MAVPSPIPQILREESPHAWRTVEPVKAISERGKLTREGFDKFLFRLDSDRDTAGGKYEVLRSKLISFFDWRNCPFPEDHADEVLTRIMRKLEAREEIRDPSTYVFGIARMLVLEIARTSKRAQVALNRLPTVQSFETESEEAQLRIHCLRQCLTGLPERSRELITQYYEGEGSSKIKRRKELAKKLGLQLNALRIRACRLREKLEQCMGRCLSSKCT